MISTFPVAVILLNALRKLPEVKTFNASCLREIIYDFLSCWGFVHLLQQLLGLFFSAAGHFGHKLQPFRFGLGE